MERKRVREAYANDELFRRNLDPNIEPFIFPIHSKLSRLFAASTDDGIYTTPERNATRTTWTEESARQRLERKRSCCDDTVHRYRRRFDDSSNVCTRTCARVRGGGKRRKEKGGRYSAEGPVALYRDLPWQI